MFGVVILFKFQPPTSNSYATTRRVPSSKPGPSKENRLENRPKSGIRMSKSKISSSESESDSDDGVMMMEPSRGPVPGEYDPVMFENLQVGEEIKELFQYITK